MTRIAVSLQLEVLPNRKVIVPGCEPVSALSSRALSSWMAENGCGNALVDLDDALAAIPGSFIKMGTNYSRGGMRQQWLVLPPVDADCPCSTYDDYYRILKGLANVPDPEETSYDMCDVIDAGFQPSPNFNEELPPPTSPYREEGTFPVEAGVLPPIPPWGLSGT